MRVLSSRCSIWKLTRVPRAPEYRRTGSEMRPKVRYPVQTEAAMAHSCLVLGNSVVGCATPLLCGQGPRLSSCLAEAPQEPNLSEVEAGRPPARARTGAGNPNRRISIFEH